ncbi:MAG: hypothetical protein ACE5NW_12155, partial [Acidiferrobacterales bacterium]
APPFQPGVDFVEATLERIPGKIEQHLSSLEGQRHAETIAAHGFEKLTERCKLTDVLRLLVVQLYVSKSKSQFWDAPILSDTHVTGAR